MNKIMCTMTTFFNELQTYQSVMKNKGPINGETNVAHCKKFHKGSSSRSKSVPSSSCSKKIQKKKRGKGKAPTVGKNKGKAKVADKGKCINCNVDGHWKRNCPKYLAEKKKEKAGKYDLLVLETCLVENDYNAWILNSGATNHICSSL